MFRGFVQVGRRFAVRSGRQARFYSASHGSVNGAGTMNKSALLLAGITTVGCVYVASGCPPLAKAKEQATASAAAVKQGVPELPVTEGMKVSDEETPESAIEDYAEPMTKPGDVYVVSEEKQQDFEVKQQESRDTTQESEPESESGFQPHSETKDEPETSSGGEDFAEENSKDEAGADRQTPGLSLNDDKAVKSVVLEKEASDKKLEQHTGPDYVKTVSSEEQESQSTNGSDSSVYGGTAEQSAVASAASAGVKGDENSEQKSAYNPETGEINWDCPCLGGMAYGPCGEEFKAAFSCFVYSEADPKGIDCVEKFSTMQNCFREYPEYYAEQIKDEEAASAEATEKEQKETTAASSSTSATEVQTEAAVFEPVLEQYVEENPHLKDTPVGESVASKKKSG